MPRENLPQAIEQLMDSVSMRAESCDHVQQIQAITANTEGCEECLQSGDRWIHLRVCLTCGHVGCCDSSKNKHATQHYRSTGHPIVMSFEPKESWAWCYPDEKLMMPR